MLKKSLFLLVLLLIFASSIHAQNLSKEETAIKKVIEDETTYFNQRNYDKWADTWVQELYIYWSVTNPHEHSELRGWEALSQMMKDQIEQSPEPVQLKQQKTDYKFRVSGNMAFVTFLEDGNASTRVLETSGGKWKLIRMGVVNSTAYETLVIQQMMKRFTGNWQAEQATIQINPPLQDSELKSINMSIKYTGKGLKVNTHSILTRPAGDRTYEEEIVYAYDTEKQRIAVLKVGGVGEWSEVYTGECSIQDDGSLHNKMYALGNAETPALDEYFSWKSDDVIHVKEIWYPHRGQPERVFTYDLVKSIPRSFTQK